MSAILKQSHLDSPLTIEIGIDEAGRGPLFGRVYASAVVLPANIIDKSDDIFDYSSVKDSKKFHSTKKIKMVADHIKQHAIAYSTEWVDEAEIDELNIRVATHKAMHKAIKNVLTKLSALNHGNKNILLLVDGDDFTPYKDDQNDIECSFICIESGDNKYASIASASILSKVARDEYINELCNTYPMLNDKYKLSNNKGYGTKHHLDGIKQHGITQWHRKTFGICKIADVNIIPTLNL